MCADLYRIRKPYQGKSPRTYLLLPQGTLVSSLPFTVLKSLGAPIFVRTIDLETGPFTEAEVKAIHEELQAQGYCMRQYASNSQDLR